MWTKRHRKSKQGEAAKRAKPDKEAIRDLQPRAKGHDVKGGTRKAGGQQHDY